jgi:hypothetical protein
MKLLRSLLNDEKLIHKLELGLLRAYLIFDIIQRLLVLGVDQAREAAKHLGLL